MNVIVLPSEPVVTDPRTGPLADKSFTVFPFTVDRDNFSEKIIVIPVEIGIFEDPLAGKNESIAGLTLSRTISLKVTVSPCETIEPLLLYLPELLNPLTFKVKSPNLR